MKNTKEEIEIRKRVKEATYFENVALSEQIIAQTMDYIASGLLLGAGIFFYVEGMDAHETFSNSYEYTKEAIDSIQHSMMIGGAVSAGTGLAFTSLSIYKNKFRKSYINFLKNRKAKIEKEIRELSSDNDIKKLSKI